VTAVLSVLVLVLTTGSWVGWAAVNRVEGGLTVDTSLGSVLSTPTPQASSGAPESYSAVNILVVGTDTRTGQGRQYGTTADASGNGHSDTAFLLHISADRKTAFAVSIPRDSWVTRPGCKADGSVDGSYVTGRFNAAFAVGGRACVIAAVKYLTGVPIQHFVEVNFNGFKAIVDALGGVTICTTHALSDPVRPDGNGGMEGSDLKLPKGVSHLTGDQALALVRARHIGNGSDLERIDRQHKFMSAMIREATSSGLLTDPVKLYRVLSSVAQSLTVDAGLTGDDLTSFLVSLQGLKPKDIRFYTVPIVGRSDHATVSWVKTAADPMWSAMIHDTAYPPKAAHPTSSSSASSSSSSAGSGGALASDASCIS
jgi:LCP family protein required for cell wall assembly